MRIVIVGGCGYIGSSLAPRLLGRGYEVKVYDLLWFGNHLPEAMNVEKRDVMDLSEDDLAGVDVVIFLAGVSNDPMAEFSPSRNFIYNASCPSYLAYIAKRAGVKRIIHGGSCSVYGYAVSQLYDETAPAVSSYPYGISKLQGEFGCLQLRDDSFSVIALRKGTVSGYSPCMRLDLVVNTMFKSALEQGVITVNNPSMASDPFDLRRRRRLCPSRRGRAGNFRRVQRRLGQLHHRRGGRPGGRGRRRRHEGRSAHRREEPPGLPQLQGFLGEGAQRPRLPSQA
jgi:nucleoside-diphosphate-sugar epimerase